MYWALKLFKDVVLFDSANIKMIFWYSETNCFCKTSAQSEKTKSIWILDNYELYRIFSAMAVGLFLFTLSSIFDFNQILESCTD